MLDPVGADSLNPVSACHAGAARSAAAFLGPGADAVQRPVEAQLFRIRLGDDEQERAWRAHAREAGLERGGGYRAVAHDQPAVRFGGCGARAQR